MKKLVFAAVLASSSLVSFAALAQSDQKKSAQPIESWEFPDDKLLNVKGATEGMSVVGGHIPVRTILARPRTHFVPELLKTIEGL